MDLQSTIERLRVSKTNYFAEEKDRGHEAGEAWAMARADYEELRRLADHEWDEWPPEAWAELFWKRARGFSRTVLRHGPQITTVPCLPYQRRERIAVTGHDTQRGCKLGFDDQQPLVIDS